MITTPKRFSLVLCALLAHGAAAETAFVDPPERVVRLSYFNGPVSIAPASIDAWADAVLNRPLTSGDRVWVDRDARAELELGTATIHLAARTGLAIAELADDTLQLQLTDGAMVIHVRALGTTETIEVDTPNAGVVLREPGEYTIGTDPGRHRTTVKTRSGEAEVTGGDAHGYLLGANQEGVFTGAAPLDAVLRGIGARTAFELWAHERDGRYNTSVAARYVAPGVIGYRDLDDYGSWTYERDYGHVWYPRRTAFADWAPYRFGRWVWVTPWGWTWIDDAPWGFAPFHYGRWTYLRSRWCWVPGPVDLRPVYAPALVAWVRAPGPGNNDVGWFPLAPRELYMPGYRSSWRHFQNINLANTPLRDDALASNAYYGHGAAIDYRNRTAPHAITIVGRDAFAGARRTGEQQHAGDWQHLKDQARAPAIDPSRASVLGAPSTPHVPVGPWPGRPRAIAPDDARPDEHSTARVPNGPRHWSGPHATGDDASTPPDVPAAVIGLPGFTPADESAAPPAVAPSTPVPGPAPYDRSRGHHNSRIGVTVPPTNEVGGDASSVRVGVPSSVDAPIGVRPSPVPTASPSIPNDRAMGRGGPGLQAPAVETPAPAPAETIEPELPDSVRWQIENR